jgi:plasmid stabilization system protein ParE
MAFEIIWLPQAKQDFEDIIDYLIFAWPLSVAKNFIRETNHITKRLEVQPYLGKVLNKSKGFRAIPFNKHLFI